MGNFFIFFDVRLGMYYTTLLELHQLGSILNIKKTFFFLYTKTQAWQQEQKR